MHALRKMKNERERRRGMPICERRWRASQKRRDNTRRIKENIVDAYYKEDKSDRVFVIFYQIGTLISSPLRKGFDNLVVNSTQKFIPSLFH